MKTIYPKNKAHFMKLMEFGEEILEMCKDLKITPIAYGSLAFFGHTKSDKFAVNDIDLLISEKDFEKITKALRKKKIKYRYDKKWHVLKATKGKLKVDLDSIDHWYKGKKDFTYLDFNGIKIKAFSFNTLKNIYKKSAGASRDKAIQYGKKYEILNNLIS